MLVLFPFGLVCFSDSLTGDFCACTSESFCEASFMARVMADKMFGTTAKLFGPNCARLSPIRISPHRFGSIPCWIEHRMKIGVLALICTVLASTCFSETNPVQIASAEIVNGSHPLLNATNFAKIKRFIMTNGLNRTYCQMYNNNPFFGFEGMNTYLNPDTGQANINCDRSKSDFNTLVIQQVDPIAYWNVTWNPERNTLVLQQAWSATPPKVLTKQVESLFEHLLTEMEKKRQSNKSEQRTGASRSAQETNRASSAAGSHR